MGEEAKESFAFWGVLDTLPYGRAEVGFREEGVTGQVLVF